MNRRSLLQSGLASMAVAPGTARAAAARDTVLVLAEGAPNSRDPHGEGVSAASLGVFTNVYDRLLNFERTEIAPGLFRYDDTRFRGELAAGFQRDGRAYVFHLRPDAVFHDGGPVTAEDVKWSLDRAMAMPASRRQLATGSLTDPGQVTVPAAHTIRIEPAREDRLTLPNLALPSASILNAAAARAHATEADPWAAGWLRQNAAGGGAYTIESWTEGQRVAYARFDAWRSGPPPAIRRAVLQVVPTSSARMVAVQQGDADIALQLPPRDIDAVRAAGGAARVVSIPLTNSFRFIAFDTRHAPFDRPQLRQAIAYALPYADLFQAGVAGHGTRLYGASGTPADGSRFPVPYPYDTDPDAVRALLEASGHEGGFRTTFSYSLADATIAAPIAQLVQESLGRFGITVAIDPVPGAQWGTRLTQKTVPFFLDTSSAWFEQPDYFFRIFFQGDWRWNFGSYDNPALNALVENARWEPDPERYRALIRQAIGIVVRALPIMPLWQPAFEAAMRADLAGFTYFIHGQVDFRPLTRS